MKTTYYTFTTWNDSAMAAGFDGSLDEGRQAAMVRVPERRSRALDGEKVIDLNAWRTANPDMFEEEPSEEPGLSAPVPRPRRSRRAMLTAELVSTASVVAAALALILRILTF